MIDNRKSCPELHAVRNYSDFTYTLYELTKMSISGIKSIVQTTGAKPALGPNCMIPSLYMVSYSSDPELAQPLWYKPLLNMVHKLAQSYNNAPHQLVIILSKKSPLFFQNYLQLIHWQKIPYFFMSRLFFLVECMGTGTSNDG